MRQAGLKSFTQAVSSPPIHSPPKSNISFHMYNRVQVADFQIVFRFIPICMIDLLSLILGNRSGRWCNSANRPGDQGWRLSTSPPSVATYSISTLAFTEYNFGQTSFLLYQLPNSTYVLYVHEKYPSLGLMIQMVLLPKYKFSFSVLKTYDIHSPWLMIHSQEKILKYMLLCCPLKPTSQISCIRQRII